MVRTNYVHDDIVHIYTVMTGCDRPAGGQQEVMDILQIMQ